MLLCSGPNYGGAHRGLPDLPPWTSSVRGLVGRLRAGLGQRIARPGRAGHHPIGAQQGLSDKAGARGEGRGGPRGYLAGLDDASSWDDLHTIASILREVVLEDRPEVLDDQDTRWRLEDALERGRARERARGRPFMRRLIRHTENVSEDYGLSLRVRVSKFGDEQGRKCERCCRTVNENYTRPA